MFAERIVVVDSESGDAHGKDLFVDAVLVEWVYAVETMLAVVMAVALVDAAVECPCDLPT